MAGMALCEPRHLYNILNQHRRFPRLAEPNYLCLLGEPAGRRPAACLCLPLPASACSRAPRSGRGRLPEETGVVGSGVRGRAHITSCTYWGLAAGAFLPSHFRCRDPGLRRLSSCPALPALIRRSQGYAPSPAAPGDFRGGQDFLTVAQRLLISICILHSANTPQKGRLILQYY